MRTARDLPEAVVPNRVEGNQTHFLDIASDEVADLSVHRGPDLVVTGEGKADTRKRCRWNERRENGARHRCQFERAREQLRHHIGIAAELIVREKADRHLPLRLLRDGVDRFLEADINGVGRRQIVAEFQFDRGGLRQDRGTFEERSGRNRTTPNSTFQKRTTANCSHCILPMDSTFSWLEFEFGIHILNSNAMQWLFLRCADKRQKRIVWSPYAANSNSTNPGGTGCKCYRF